LISTSRLYWRDFYLCKETSQQKGLMVVTTDSGRKGTRLDSNKFMNGFIFLSSRQKNCAGIRRKKFFHATNKGWYTSKVRIFIG
jgi:hypothetical protein